MFWVFFKILSWSVYVHAFVYIANNIILSHFKGRKRFINTRLSLILTGTGKYIIGNVLDNIT